MRVGIAWRCARRPQAHEAIADALWTAASDADAEAELERLGRERVAGWEEALRASGRDGGDASRGGGQGVGGPTEGEGRGGRRGGGEEEWGRG